MRFKIITIDPEKKLVFATEGKNLPPGIPFAVDENELQKLTIVPIDVEATWKSSDHCGEGRRLENIRVI
jgi:hypothetical protein